MGGNRTEYPSPTPLLLILLQRRTGRRCHDSHWPYFGRLEHERHFASVEAPCQCQIRGLPSTLVLHLHTHLSTSFADREEVASLKLPPGRLAEFALPLRAQHRSCVWTRSSSSSHPPLHEHDPSSPRTSFIISPPTTSLGPCPRPLLVLLKATFRWKRCGGSAEGPHFLQTFSAG